MPNTSGISASTNFDIDSIVNSLMTVEQRPLILLNQQKTSYQSKISAYATLQSSLSSFQTALANLSTSAKFNVQAATSSDSSVFTATSSGNATVSNYAIKVIQLAQSQKLATASFASTSATVGSGTMTITLGKYDSATNTFTANPDKTAKNITISAANSSLTGIRDAINAGDAGVTATIVSDGQSGSRLVLTSKESGEVNSIKVSVADADGNNSDGDGLSRLAYDPSASAGAGKNLTELQGARNAKLNIDGIDVQSTSNVVTGVLSGITLNLFKTSPDNAVSLNVTKDAKAIKDSVTAFVTAFNAVNTTLRNLTKYDDSTTKAADKKNGALLGDATARSISSQIKMALTKSVGGTDNFATLSQIGVAIQRDGSLALDASKLEKAIDTNLDDVAKLFAAVGKSSDAETRFVAQSAKTQSGNYAINITQAATQGSLTGNAAPDLNIVAGNNDKLSLKLNGVEYHLTLEAGNYGSVQELAQQVQTQLAKTKTSSTVSVDGGMLKITSPEYGSGSTVEVTGGNAASSLFGSSPAAVQGLDVAGTINGAEATGKGQVLTSTAVGNPAEGLVISVRGNTTGDRGHVSLSVGYASQLNELVKGFVSDNGLLANRTDGLQDSIKRVTTQEDALQVRLAAVQARYRSQFVALDVLMTNMKNTQSYLAQQLAALSANK